MTAKLLLFGVVLGGIFVWRFSRPRQVERAFWNPPGRFGQATREGFLPGPQAARERGAAKKKLAEASSGPRAAAPQFLQSEGVFKDETKVELKAASSTAKIRYTLDGSEPTAGSRDYSGPFAVTGTTLVKAKAFEPGVGPSLTVSQTYTQIDPGLAEFTSNLPLVIINPFGQGIHKPDSVVASLRVIDPKGKRCSLSDPSDYDGRCEIKVRGFSSLRFPKHSFTVKTRDDSGLARKASILGLPENSDWVLYAPYSDKTLMRDVLAYELSNKMGRWAAHTRYVEVFVSRTGGKLTRRDYVGVYVFEEKIKRGKERVNIAKLSPQDNAEPDVSGGYIFKRDHVDRQNEGPFNFFNGNQASPSGDGAGFSTSRGMHLFYVEPKEAEITSEQKAWLSRYLNQFERTLYGSSFKNPTEGYAKYLDVDSFIDQFWIVELSKNVDGFRYSCFMSKDRNGKLRMEPIWDWNLSFGNANYHEGFKTEGWYWPLLRESEVSWYRRLRQDPEFMQRVIDRWAELRRTIFQPDSILKRVDELAAQLDEAQDRNFRKWQILGQMINPNWYVGGSYGDEVNWMKNWISERIAWIDSQFVPAPVLSRKESSGQSPTKVTIKGSGGNIYYTVDGSDPRQKGGTVSPQAREYTETLVLEPGTKVFARSRTENSWSGPAVGFVPAKTAAIK